MRDSASILQLPVKKSNAKSGREVGQRLFFFKQRRCEKDTGGPFLSLYNLKLLSYYSNLNFPGTILVFYNQMLVTNPGDPSLIRFSKKKKIACHENH